MVRYLVVGLGPSVEGFDPTPGCTTIGVNDVGRFHIFEDCTMGAPIKGIESVPFIPDHLMVVDSHKHFGHHPKRAVVINKAKVNKFIWCRSAGFWPPWQGRDDIRFFNIMRYRKVEDIAAAFKRPDKLMRLPHQNSSVYTAISLAAAMGATDIDVIGLDLHKGDPTNEKNRHMLGSPKKIEWVNKAFGQLGEALATLDIRVTNLSPNSLVTSLPQR